MSAPAPEAMVRRSSAKLRRAELKHAEKNLEGRIVRCTMSVACAMRTMSRTLVTSSQLDLAVKDPSLITPSSRNCRPCLILAGSRANGYAVLPLATFANKDPDTMDDLLHAVVFPIGDVASIHKDFLERPRFQTDPPWDVENGSAFIVPQIMQLPARTHIQPLRGSISASDLAELYELCSGFTTRMVAEKSAEELKTLIKSFIAYDRMSPQRKAAILLKKKKAFSKNAADEDDEEDLDAGCGSEQSPTSGFDSVAPSSYSDSDTSTDCGTFDAFSSASSVSETSEASSSEEYEHNDVEPPTLRKKSYKRARFARRSKKPGLATGKENAPPDLGRK